MSVSLRLALDWTPNTLHTGFYVALAQGLYRQADINLRIGTPEADHYQTTPARQLAQGAVDLAIMPSESVISYHANDPAAAPVAIAALLARDASAIVTLGQSGLDRPAKLDGRVYASYNARYEDEIVRQLIQHDGGQGQFLSRKPERLGIWHTLLTGEADATWVFLPWEGVEAEQRGVALNTFMLGDYGIPYGYSPLLVANRDWLTSNHEVMQRFMLATAAGYTFAAEQPDEAARLLMKTAQHSTLTDETFVQASQRAASAYYLTEANRWGLMQPDVWNAFTGWLAQYNLLTDRTGQPQTLQVEQLFTNELLG